MNEIIVKDNIKIEDLIYEVRGKEVMLDSDLARLYECKNGTKEKTNHIFYNGQIYDAYSLLVDILSKAKKEIIIIDNYAGKELFDITKNIKINIKVYTKNIDNAHKDKYERQYNNLTIINTDFFMIDL